MTHDQADMPSHPVRMLEEVDNAAWHHDVIAIDEGQFLPGMCRLCVLFRTGVCGRGM